VKRLAAPLRLTWDWDWPPITHPGSPPGRPTPDAVRTIGAEIVRSRALMLEVGYPDPEALLSGELAEALAGFEGRLSLVFAPAAAAALAERRPWAALDVEEVWLDATPGAGAVSTGLESWPAVRFYLTAGNLDAVAAEIERVVAGGSTAISLPSLPLFGAVLPEAEAATPSARQMTGLAGRMAAVLRGRPAIDVQVHHYGLWQALRAGGVRLGEEHSSSEGCQAGSGLAYIDPHGILYPCASLPIPLARVGAGSIAHAWSGADLAALREQIGRRPAGCSGCPGEPVCRGGCRGWAHYLTGSWDSTGPDCVRP
jgi:radical SAM protein with 4Fe4S-binding SPASM domain